MKEMYQQRKLSHPKCKAYSQLKPYEVDRWVIEEFAKNGDGDDWSITCFFMAFFDGLLFPTSSLRLSGETYYHCKRVSEVSQYDLCTALIEDLTKKVGKWKKSADKRSLTTTSVQGCVVLFLMYYLDNLQCPQHMLQDASTTPRAALLNRVIADIARADKKRLSDGSYTYGNLPFRSKVGTCYENVRGDEPHTPEVTTIPAASSKRKLGDQEKQQAIAKALQHYDERMDLAMLKIEEGTKLAAQGKMELQDTHSKVVQDASMLTSPRDDRARRRAAARNATDQQMAAKEGTSTKDASATAQPHDASVADATAATAEEMAAQQGTPNELGDVPETGFGTGTATEDSCGTAQTHDASVADASAATIEGGDAAEQEGDGPSITTPSPAPSGSGGGMAPPVFDPSPLSCPNVGGIV
ncbi:unnamed protein product [Urochloa humidicola]